MSGGNARSPVFGVNRLGRDFVLRDIHGQLAMVDALLVAVGFDPKQDRLFSVGDLVDRGMKSAEVLERFTGSPGHFAIRGTHEAMMIASDGSLAHFKLWQQNGGSWALPLALPRRQALAALAAELPLTMTLELADGRRVGLVHAEVPPGQSWKVASTAVMGDADLWDIDGRSTAASLLWGRRRFMTLVALSYNTERTVQTASSRTMNIVAAEPVPGIDLIICGHSILESRQPALLGNTLFIDTDGFQKNGRLTMIEPLTGTYWQCRHQGLAVKVIAKPQRIPGLEPRKPNE